MKYIEVSSNDLLHRFTDYLQALNQGQHFIIAVDGVRRARLTPVLPETSLDAHDALEAMKRLQTAPPVSHETIRAWIEEGRE
ncbi:hypothetical protein [Achromobacter spanius]|uniref:hypothetical protein n=1 Tax=Achromobacter spanius TaxID=217203 RepID=UPI0032093BB7